MTIENPDKTRTMKVSEWLDKDPVAFDTLRKKSGLKIESKAFEILVSKLRASYPDYFKDALGINMRIDFKGYAQPVKAVVPYKNNPVEFYKWWCENPEKVLLSFQEKLQLFNKVNLVNANILKSEHRKIINTGKK